MKKHLCFVLCLLLALVLAACGAPESPPAAGTGDVAQTPPGSAAPPTETTPSALPEPSPEPSVPASPEPAQTNPPEVTTPEPSPSEPPEAASSLRVPVPPEDWVAPVFEWENPGNHGPGVWHVDFTFWREEADGWQFFTGLHEEKLPLPAEEAEEESWEGAAPIEVYPLSGGYWRHLTWPGLELLCYHCGPERDVVLSITITDPEIVTFRGVHVGCTLEDLLASQGEGQVVQYNGEFGDYVYTGKGFGGTHSPRIIFRFEDGAISHIHLEYYTDTSGSHWWWSSLLPADE